MWCMYIPRQFVHADGGDVDIKKVLKLDGELQREIVMNDMGVYCGACHAPPILQCFLQCFLQCACGFGVCVCVLWWRYVRVRARARACVF